MSLGSETWEHEPSKSIKISRPLWNLCGRIAPVRSRIPAPGRPTTATAPLARAVGPPRCGAHGDGGPGGCPHAGYRPGTDGGCGGHFPTPGMGRGQRSSKWQGLLLQSKHWGDQVGSSLRWKRQWLELKFPNKWMRVRFQLSFNWFTCWRLKIAKFQSAECQEMSRVYSVRRSTLYVCLDQVFLPSA